MQTELSFVLPKDLAKFMCKKRLLSDLSLFGTIAKPAGITRSSTGSLSYFHLIKILAKPIFCAALENLCALLLQSRMKYLPLSLSLKVCDYQRSIYLNGIMNYNRLPQDDKDIMKAVRDWNQYEKNKHGSPYLS